MTVSRFYRTMLCLLMALLCSPSKAQQKVVGYVPNWASLFSIDYSKVTHLNIAFENPDAAGNLSFETIDDTYILQAHANGKKILVSIGGGGASEDPVMQARYFDLISDAKRAGFVSKIVAYISDHNFDGLDVDLEGPAINADYGKFITDLSSSLKPQSKLLSAALTHTYGGSDVPNDAMLLFDYINIMAYDATGPWDPSHPGPHSSFDFAVTSLTYWINRGLPKANAVLGVPFYGYGFGADFNDGITYSQIVNAYAGAEYRDVSGNTIYYNGIPTIKQKTQYVVDGQYGGIMIWELSQDKPSTDGRSLLRAIDQVINNTVAGLEEDKDAIIAIYPNPLKTTLNLQVKNGFKGGQLAIIDSSGRKLLEGKVENDAIDVSSLSPGLYILRLMKDQRSVSKKFMKD